MQFLSATFNRPIPIELRNWTVISELNFGWKGTWNSFFGRKKGTKKLNRQKKVISRVLNTSVRVIIMVLYCHYFGAVYACERWLFAWNLFFWPLICDVLEVIPLRVLLLASFSLIVECIQINTIINISSDALLCHFPLDFGASSKDTLSAPLTVINHQ